jgi:glycerol-3-phosphate dehydrogenase
MVSMTQQHAADFDALVVGGGINGAGIARELAGRGLRVALIERGDWGGATSSASSKLVHGGLRYLEQGLAGLALVRKSLQERERLLRANPHLMRPLRLLLPQGPGSRPAWQLRAGLWLYDHLAASSLPRSGPQPLPGERLRECLRQGFAYSDGWVDDARLVLACVSDAAARGAWVRRDCALRRAEAVGGLWRAQTEAGELRARALVNAAGPWAATLLHEALGEPDPPRLRWVQGAHLVLPRRWAEDEGMLLQADDGRVIFALPYEQDFLLLGTTDTELPGPDSPGALPQEVDYLCAQASRWLREPVRPEQVLHRMAGVRPLLAEGGSAQGLSRDYRLDLHMTGALRLDVWGGKLTTFRLLAEQAGALLAPRLGGGPAWTADAPLPGGDCGPLPAFVAALRRAHPQADPALLLRLARAHGSGVHALLRQGWGAELAPGVFEAELHHAREQEWARSAADFLWRRSKLGLRLDATAQAAVAAWFKA